MIPALCAGIEVLLSLGLCFSLCLPRFGDGTTLRFLYVVLGALTGESELAAGSAVGWPLRRRIDRSAVKHCEWR